MTENPTTSEWQVTRQRIYQRFLGKLPRHKRDILDLVELIHATFPEWKWLEIARWIDGTLVPTGAQQISLRDWELAHDQPHRPASHIQLIAAPTLPIAIQPPLQNDI